jgi:hypothetical protein
VLSHGKKEEEKSIKTQERFIAFIPYYRYLKKEVTMKDT